MDLLAVASKILQLKKLNMYESKHNNDLQEAFQAGYRNALNEQETGVTALDPCDHNGDGTVGWFEQFMCSVFGITRESRAKGTMDWLREQIALCEKHGEMPGVCDAWREQLAEYCAEFPALCGPEVAHQETSDGASLNPTASIGKFANTRNVRESFESRWNRENRLNEQYIPTLPSWPPKDHDGVLPDSSDDGIPPFPKGPYGQQRSTAKNPVRSPFGVLTPLGDNLWQAPNGDYYIWCGNAEGNIDGWCQPH